jgi:hypothetical protein
MFDLTIEAVQIDMSYDADHPASYINCMDGKGRGHGLYVWCAGQFQLELFHPKYFLSVRIGLNYRQ